MWSHCIPCTSTRAAQAARVHQRLSARGAWACSVARTFGVCCRHKVVMHAGSPESNPLRPIEHAVRIDAVCLVMLPQ